MRVIHLSSLALLAALGMAEIRADVSLPPLISDHMVLQRDMKVPIWGTAEAGETVKVSFAGQSKSVTADKDGKWRVDLDPLKASAESRELAIAGKNTITLKDVLVGEVWLGSGQSNMDMALMEYPNVEAGAAPLVDNPQVRFCGWKESAKGQGSKLTGWFVFNKDNAAHCSVMMVFFGTRLQKELGVPIGLIPRAVGGTPSVPWCPENAFNARFAKADPTPATTEPTRRSFAGGLFRSKVSQCIPYAIRGVVWDQGESGSGMPGINQSDLMQTLIVAWRKEWQRTDADFPFILVQKPSGDGWNWSPSRKGRDGKPPNLPRLPEDPANTNDKGSGGFGREDYQKIADVPNTAIANAMGLGHGAHPPDKEAYGLRLADTALGMVYGKDVPWLTPRYDSMTVDGDKIRIKMRDVKTALVPAPGTQTLTGFSIAGEDRKFVWADAKITGVNTLEVWSDKVPKPVAVRYAWADAPKWANLFAKEGLPVWAFRTDNWPKSAKSQPENLE